MSFIPSFVEWESTHNVLVCMGKLILQQGNNGVPIGNCISQQASEIWFVQCEHKPTDTWFNMEVPNTWERHLSEIAGRSNVHVPADAALTVPGITEFVPWDTDLLPPNGV